MKGYKNVRWPRLATGLLSFLCVTAAHAKPGDLNPAFGIDGQVQLPLASFFTVTSPVAVDRQGRIVGGVEITNVDSTSSRAVFALLPDGRVDASFGGSAGVGFSSVLPDAQAQIAGLVVDANGRIVIAATDQSSTAAVFERLLPDGTPDVTFGIHGITVVAMPGKFDTYFAQNIGIDSSGDIIAAGEVLDSVAASATVVKLDSNGNPALFGEHGVLVVNPGVGTVQSLASGVALDNNDNAIVSGAVLQQDGSIRGLLMKFKSNGTFDLTFGNGGSLEVDALPSQKKHFTEFTAVTVDAHNRIVATGPTQSDAGKSAYFTTRLLPNGAPDTSFTPAFGDSQSAAQPSSVHIDSVGRIVVSGLASGSLIVYRLTSAGEPDTTFADTGQRLFDQSSLVESSALTADDNIVVYSAASDGLGLAITEFLGN
jgi:uncharacterized delta-60 repeat protein